MRLPNGYGGVVNLGKNRRRPFAVRITADWTAEGKAVYKYLSYHNTRKEALQALAEYNNNPYDLVNAQLTFAEVYQLWADRELVDVSNSKKLSYTTAYKRCESLYKLKIKDIRAMHLQKILDNNSDMSISSLNNLRKLFSQVFKFAIKNDFINKDYSKFVTASSNTTKKEKHDFSEDEIAILWQHTDEFYIKMLLILIYTGFRINELLSLRIENIDIDSRIMKGGSKTKAGKDRLVPIHKRILPFIIELYKAKNEYLYCDEKGKLKYQPVRNNIEKILSKLNMSHTPHECRHTTATLLDRYGANPVSIKKILGHSTNDITSSVYIHKSIDELIQAIDLIP